MKRITYSEVPPGPIEAKPCPHCNKPLVVYGDKFFNYNMYTLECRGCGVCVELSQMLSRSLPAESAQRVLAFKWNTGVDVTHEMEHGIEVPKTVLVLMTAIVFAVAGVVWYAS